MLGRYAKNWIFHQNNNFAVLLFKASAWLFNHAVCKIGLKLNIFFRKFVHSVDKTTGSRQKSIAYSLAGVGRPYHIVNVPQECPNLVNSCQV
jgi:hypothetical protein